MNEIKKEWKFIVPADFLEYEAYLSEMNRKGWKLKKISLSYLHYFEKCEPESYHYEIEASDKPLSKEELSHLVSLYADFGYELVFQSGILFFFRKRQEEKGMSEESIRELNEKWSRIKSIYKNYPLTLLMPCIYLSQTLFHFLMDSNPYLLTIETIFFVITFPFILPIFHGYIRYRKMERNFRTGYK